jgi:ArsR family transcriptional regulator
MSSVGPKRALFEQFAALAKTLGHFHRLELLEQLAQGERSVEALAAKVGLSVANASQHLHRMRGVGIVTARREGKCVYYRVADDAVLDLVGSLRRVAEKTMAEVDRIVRSYFRERDSLEPVSREELLLRLNAGTATVLDVRPEDEFVLGHLPGAINVPLRSLKQRLGELDSSQDIVAYCRGPYCVLAYEAAAELRAQGFTVHRLEDGFPEWRAAGFPVVAGAG